MKNIAFISAFLFAFTCTKTQGQTTQPESKAVISFECELHDFGHIPEGTIATFEFKLKNTGTDPLIITEVKASCGCTTPDWTKEPILPGKTGFVKASFNSKGRVGNFSKSITVTSNTKNSPKVLTIKGVVDKEKQEPTSPVFTDPQPVVKPW